MDDFEFDIYGSDENGNTASYREYNDGDLLFNTSDEYESDDSLDFL